MAVGDIKRVLFMALAVTLALAVPARADDHSLSVKLRASEATDAQVIEEVELYGSSHALVIGIDNYTGGWPRLSMAVQDAKRIAAALEKRSFQVTLKFNLDSKGLKAAFEEFFVIGGENSEARLFVWFAGHGHTEDGEGYLIPADAPRPDAGGRFRLKALSLRRFGEFVRQARSKHAFAVFDSCFSGTVFDSARELPPSAVTRATTLPVRQFLTSGDAGQTVSDDGTFRELFIRALGGEERADTNGDGYLTASELGMFLADRVTNLTQSKQTPRYGKLRDKDWDRGDFVFAMPEGGRQVAAAPSPRKAGPASISGKPSLARQTALEVAFWQSIENSSNPADFEAYLDKFAPAGAFTVLARNRIAALKSGQSAGAKAPGQNGKSDQELAAEALIKGKRMLLELMENTEFLMGSKEIPLTERVMKFRGMLGYVVEFEPMAKFVLGDHREGISSEQWGNFYLLYRELFLSGYTFTRAKSWAGHYEMVGIRPYGRDTLVQFKLKSPNQNVLRVGFRIRRKVDSFFGFKIIDVIVNGMSLLVTQRDDFKSVLKRIGVSGLIETLEAKYGKVEKVIEIPG